MTCMSANNYLLKASLQNPEAEEACLTACGGLTWFKRKWNCSPDWFLRKRQHNTTQHKQSSNIPQSLPTHTCHQHPTIATYTIPASLSHRQYESQHFPDLRSLPLHGRSVQAQQRRGKKICTGTARHQRIVPKGLVRHCRRPEVRLRRMPSARSIGHQIRIPRCW